jgi:hypothetical protein
MAARRFVSSLLLCTILLCAGARFAGAQVKAVITGEDHYVADHTGNPETDGTTVYFEGTASEGDIAYWQWGVSGFYDYNADGPYLDGWATGYGYSATHYPYTVEYSVSLYVEDAEGNSDYTEKTFYVEFRNDWPVVDAGQDQSFFAPAGLNVTLHGSAADPEGDPTKWVDWWEGSLYGYGPINDDSSLDVTVFLKPGVYTFWLVVGDAYSNDYGPNFGYDSVTVTVYGARADSLSKSACFAREFPPTITVTGQSFQKGATITWNGAPTPTIWLSATQVRASLTPEQIALAGVFKVAVTNPDGGFSNALDFTVKNRAPYLKALDPTSVVHGSPSFTLNVVGERFAPGAVLLWKGEPRPTVYVSPTLIQATVLGSDVATAGSAAVAVNNPGPGGGNSNARTFYIR